MKNTFFKKLLAVSLALVIVVSAFSGCNTSVNREIDFSKANYTTGEWDNFSPASLKQSQKLTSTAQRSNKKKNTILIYMVGSDLESKGGYATRDLQEMARSWVDTKTTNVLVYAGGSNSWSINIPSNQNTLLSLRDGDFYPVAKTSVSANMGDAAVLKDFLDFSYNNYPSDNYSLIFWNHGGGPIYGYGVDEQYNDVLYLHELKWAMKNSPFKTKKLSFVGFDACLMATLETAQVFAPYANYFVASEEIEPGAGWNYGFLSAYSANSNPTPLEVTNEILKYYESYLKTKKSYYTLSTIDLTKLNTLLTATDSLFLEMAKGALTGDFKNIATARYNTKRFGIQSNTKLENSYDLVDLYHMARMLGSDYSTVTNNLKKALDKVVVGNVSSFNNTCGVSVYYPYDNFNSFVNGNERYIKATFNCYGYQAFLTAFTSKWIRGRKQITWESIKPSYYQSPTAQNTQSSSSKPSTSSVTTSSKPPVSSTTPVSSAPVSSTAPVSSEPVSSAAPVSSAPVSSAQTSSNVTSSAPSGYTPPSFNTSSNVTSSAPSGYTPPSFNTSSEETQSTPDTFYSVTVGDSVSDIVGAVYNVLYYDEDESTFTPILTDCEAEIENGVIKMPEDPYVYLLKTDRSGGENVDESLLPVVQMKDGVFVNQSVLLSSGEAVIGAIEPIQIAFSDNGEIKVMSILMRGENEQFYGKGDVDLSKFKTIGNLNYSYKLTRDENEKLLPTSQWSQMSGYTINYLPYDSNIVIEKKRLSQTGGKYAVEVLVKDVHGESHVVEFKDNYSKNDHVRFNQVSKEGTMWFRVYSDHAELLFFSKRFDFKGTVTIPDKINMQPVTVIKSEAFAGISELEGVVLPQYLKVIEQGAFKSCYNLKDVQFKGSVEHILNEAFYLTKIENITLPNTLKSIGWRAFACTNLKNVTIPSSVTNIGAGAFYGCNSLTSFIANSSYYTSVDGVLFSANKKTLVAYPGGKSSSYTVPSGTEVIFAESFRECEKLSEITFPETLKKIENLAFCDTLNLKAINLPLSLESVDSAAFSKSMTSKTVSAPMVIKIPKAVSYVGEEAFTGYNVSAFEVDVSNENYSSKDGALLNKTGTKLFMVPNQTSGAYTVPSGVNYVESSAFDGCNLILEITFPDSVTAVSLNAGVPSGVRKVNVGKGMIKFNNLKHLFGKEIVISPDNPNYKVENGVIYSADMTKLYLFNSTVEYYAMPQSVKEIVSGAFVGLNSTLKTITLSSSLEKMPDGAFGNLTELENIYVDENNKTYLSEDGIVYSKDGKVLISCPMGKTGAVNIKEGTEEIAVGALYNTFYFKATSITFPDSLKKIGASNIMSSNPNIVLEIHVPKSVKFIDETFLNYVSPTGVTVYAPVGSTAYKFAKTHGNTVKTK